MTSAPERIPESNSTGVEPAAYNVWQQVQSWNASVRLTAAMIGAADDVDSSIDCARTSLGCRRPFRIRGILVSDRSQGRSFQVNGLPK